MQGYVETIIRSPKVWNKRPYSSNGNSTVNVRRSVQGIKDNAIPATLPKKEKEKENHNIAHEHKFKMSETDIWKQRY